MASAALKSASTNAPSKLTQLLAQLNASPRLSLTGIKALKLSYAYRNDHWGARHFAKEHLPRIRWANPELDIQVERVKKAKEEEWRPELEVHFQNGKAPQTFNLQGKWSTAIVKELMDLAGGAEWQKHKTEALVAEKPVIPGEEYEMEKPPYPVKMNAPSLARFRELNKGKEPTSTPGAASTGAQASASL